MASLNQSAGASPAAPQKTLTTFGRINAILGGSAGNLVEWYDWFAYSSFSLYFAQHFFPKGDQTAQLLQAAAVFAVGFLMRPIGAWLMGLYADWAGRRTALTASVALMSAGSFAIALIPDFKSIGVAAPALLLLARLVQGLSLGGEYGASATYMTEMAGKGRRGFWSSFQYLTLIAGQLLALGVLILLQNILTKEDLQAWGWRIPFAIGGLLAIVVFWIRSGLQESKAYIDAKAAGAERAKTRMLSGRYRKETLMIFGLTSAGSLSFYAYTTYMQKFLVNTAGFSKDVGTTITAGALLFYMLIQPLVGWISDKVGRRNVMFTGLAVGAVITVPCFTAIGATHDAWLAFLLMSVMVLAHSGYSSVNAAIKAELFPTHVRALGVALPYALANAMFGGTAEYVALWFKQGGREGGFYIYVALAMAIGALVVTRLPNTNASIHMDD